jgi:hypothetical protein
MPAGVTIRHLEVHLEVEGSDEEVAFLRLFNRQINRWWEAQQEQDARRRQHDAERMVTGPDEFVGRRA